MSTARRPIAASGSWTVVSAGCMKRPTRVSKNGPPAGAVPAWRTEPQPVPRLDLAAALADIEHRPYESVTLAAAMGYVMPRD